jgi:hypothetical protein
MQVRIAALKREEDQLGREKDALDVAKLKHQRSAIRALVLFVHIHMTSMQCMAS